MNIKSSAYKLIVGTLLIGVLFSSCIINNPQPEDCEIISTRIIEIEEGTSYDIVFHDNQGARYYINRGLEQGLKME